MEITVKLYLGLKRCLPKATDGIEVKHFSEDRQTLIGLLNALEIPPEDVMIILVNGGSVMEFGDMPDEELHDGDVVEILPHIVVGG